jgi:hypothetical protein
MVMSQARAHRNPHASRAEHMSESRPSRRLPTARACGHVGPTFKQNRCSIEYCHKQHSVHIPQGASKEENLEESVRVSVLLCPVPVVDACEVKDED